MEDHSLMNMTVTQKISLGLSGAAFALFTVNQYLGLRGTPLNFSGSFGALVLTLFLAMGTMVQISKLVQGHQSRTELLLTFLQLFAHTLAEISIWTQTQILGLELSPDIGKWIVSSYWLIGLVDILTRYLPREFKLFAKGHETPTRRMYALEAQVVKMEEQLKAREEQLIEKNEELRDIRKKEVRQARRQARRTR